ncbi:succinylglutamate desuccinylase [Arenibacter sp. 6A1]|uniref:succinylglutamate desuccinylase/aspartoacylase family protein n=1 Tax=Arenibacter sp. 6A1 TaxID=2720391 RepID=UPI001446A0E4|nr:succinylglutamate desuccinylase/aspartoacylase family protein [Arenibacter sp. 6A1]NKI26779.1 succinylglutamate desuccinylase [Arenibacter sp. 6A1]
MESFLENKDIVIGGEKVAPGQEKWLHINIDRLPTGTIIDIPIYVVNATEPGPVILIQAGLHGDEINGIEIVRRMLQKKKFKIQRGAVIVVPLLNVFGFLHFSRDVPDGKDVNRSFPGSKTGSLASRIAYYYTTQIFPLINFGIDLHTGGGRLANYPQTRFTKDDKDSKLLAEIFNAPFSFPSGLIANSFRKVAYTKGIATIVYEAGESMRFDHSAIVEGIQGIQNILTYFKMTPQSSSGKDKRPPTIHLSQRRWLRAPTAGMFVPKVLNGTPIKKNQVLGIVSDTFAKYVKEIKAPYDGYVFCINHQGVVNQGDALLHVGTVDLA